MQKLNVTKERKRAEEEEAIGNISHEDRHLIYETIEMHNLLIDIWLTHSEEMSSETKTDFNKTLSRVEQIRHYVYTYPNKESSAANVKLFRKLKRIIRQLNIEFDETFFTDSVAEYLEQLEDL